MPDIFDQIAPLAAQGDIFDQIAPHVAVENRPAQMLQGSIRSYNPSILQRLEGFLHQQPAGSIGYNLSQSIQQTPQVIQALSAPPPAVADMKPGVGKAIGEQLTLPNALVAGSAPTAVPALMETAQGRAMLGAIMSYFGVTGAQGAGTAFGQASAEPAGGQRRYDLATGAIDAATALPAAGVHMIDVAPKLSGVSAGDVAGPKLQDFPGQSVGPERQISRQPVRFTGAQNGDIFDALAPVKQAAHANDIAPKPSELDPAILQAIQDAGMEVSKPVSQVNLQAPKPAINPLGDVLEKAIAQKELPLADNTTLPPLGEGERIVTVKRPDGTTYPAAYSDKAYNFNGQLMPSIAKVVNGGWSHGILPKGDTIIEGGELNASKKPSTESVSQHEVRTQMGGETSLQQQGQAAGTQQSASKSITPQQKGAAGLAGLLDPKHKFFSGLDPEMADYAGRQFVSQAEKLLRDPKAIGFAQNAQVDAGQMVNRLKNKFGADSTEWKMLKEVGIEGYLKGGKKTPMEVADWVKEHAPQVSVHSYGMEGKVSEAKSKYDEAMGELDKLGYHLDSAGRLTRRGSDFTWDDSNPNITPEMRKWIQQGRDNAAQAKADASVKATSYYSSVSALPTDEPMPDWTATKSGKNVQRVDVVVPQKKYSKAERVAQYEKTLTERQGHALTPEQKKLSDEMHSAFTSEEEPIKWGQDNLHENLPNTLGWAMIQYKTGPKGEKIAVIAEAQSRWGQMLQKQKKQYEEAGATLFKHEETPQYHPLLRDYNRLILKAAIEQARKEGATHIMLSDAETAMMTEGHDAHGEKMVRIEPTPENINRAKIANETRRVGEGQHGISGDKLVKLARGEAVTVGEGAVGPAHLSAVAKEWNTRIMPHEEPGMRLNYDTILPKIMEELTGSKGEKVSLGEHKNAYEYHPTAEEQRLYEYGDPANYGKKRSNLIFRNADGTPKTDISGIMYPIDKPAVRLAAGEPMTTTGKMYSGLPFLDPGEKSPVDLVKDAKKLAQPIIDKVSDALAKGEVVRAMTYRRDAIDNMANQVAREGASDVAGPLKRMAKTYKLSEKLTELALTPVREANGSKVFLEEQIKEAKMGALKGKPKGDIWLKAAQYGLDNWKVINHIAENFYKPVTEKLISDVIGSGKNVEHREGYVRHMPESKRGSSFVHAREYNTLFDRIKAGSDPISLNAIDLLRTGIHDAQRLYVQTKAYIKWGEQVKDPVSGRPILVGKEQFENPRKGLEDVAADIRPPAGYTEARVGGQRVGVLEEYANVLHRLTDPSWFNKGGHVSTAFKEAAGAGKHILFGFDTVHLARMASVESGIKLGTGGLVRRDFLPSYKKGVLALDNSPKEIGNMLKVGAIDKETYDHVMRQKEILNKVLPYGVNIGRVSDAIYQHWTEKVPITGRFQKWLFGTFQRGAMAESVSLVWDMNKKQHPEWTEAQVNRETAKGINTVFRNLGRQGLSKSATGNDAMRLFLAAPQWTFGTLKYEGGAMVGAVKGVTGLAKGEVKFNLESRVVGSLIAAYIVFNQVINMATTGHSTFENEKGHRLAAWIPGKEGGFWVDPTAMALEATHAIGKALDRTQGDAIDTAKQWLDPKLGTVVRPLAVAAFGREWGMTGPVVPKGDRLKEAAKNVVPVPIFTTPLLHPEAGKTEQQLLRSVGLNVDAEQTARSQIYQMVRKWKKDNNIAEQTGEFPPSKYVELNNALRHGSMKEAQTAYETLKSQVGDNLVQRYYKNYTDHAFAGSKANEEKFVASLDAKQRAIYDTAVKGNQVVKENFFKLIGQDVPPAAEDKPKSGKRKKRFSMFGGE